MAEKDGAHSGLSWDGNWGVPYHDSKEKTGGGLTVGGELRQLTAIQVLAFFLFADVFAADVLDGLYARPTQSSPPGR